MHEPFSPSEYLVVFRGQGGKDVSREEIQNAVDQFYGWLARLVHEGKMNSGEQLASEERTVPKRNVVTDGPFGETKEVIGG